MKKLIFLAVLLFCAQIVIADLTPEQQKQYEAYKTEPTPDNFYNLPDELKTAQNAWEGIRTSAKLDDAKKIFEMLPNKQEKFDLLGKLRPYDKFSSLQKVELQRSYLQSKEIDFSKPDGYNANDIAVAEEFFKGGTADAVAGATGKELREFSSEASSNFRIKTLRDVASKYFAAMLNTNLFYIPEDVPAALHLDAQGRLLNGERFAPAGTTTDRTVTIIAKAEGGFAYQKDNDEVTVEGNADTAVRVLKDEHGESYVAVGSLNSPKVSYYMKESGEALVRQVESNQFTVQTNDGAHLYITPEPGKAVSVRPVGSGIFQIGNVGFDKGTYLVQVQRPDGSNEWGSLSVTSQGGDVTFSGQRATVKRLPTTLTGQDDGNLKRIVGTSGFYLDGFNFGEKQGFLKMLSKDGEAFQKAIEAYKDPTKKLPPDIDFEGLFTGEGVEGVSIVTKYKSEAGPRRIEADFDPSQPSFIYLSKYPTGISQDKALEWIDKMNVFNTESGAERIKQLLLEAKGDKEIGELAEQLLKRESKGFVETITDTGLALLLGEYEREKSGAIIPTPGNIKEERLKKLENDILKSLEANKAEISRKLSTANGLIVRGTADNNAVFGMLARADTHMKVTYTSNPASGLKEEVDMNIADAIIDTQQNLLTKVQVGLKNTPQSGVTVNTEFVERRGTTGPQISRLETRFSVYGLDVPLPDNVLPEQLSIEERKKLIEAKAGKPQKTEKLYFVRMPQSPEELTAIARTGEAYNFPELLKFSDQRKAKEVSATVTASNGKAHCVFGICEIDPATGQKKDVVFGDFTGTVLGISENNEIMIHAEGDAHLTDIGGKVRSFNGIVYVGENGVRVEGDADVEYKKDIAPSGTKGAAVSVEKAKSKINLAYTFADDTFTFGAEQVEGGEGTATIRNEPFSVKKFSIKSTKNRYGLTIDDLNVITESREPGKETFSLIGFRDPTTAGWTHITVTDEFQEQNRKIADTADLYDFDTGLRSLADLQSEKVRQLAKDPNYKTLLSKIVRDQIEGGGGPSADLKNVYVSSVDAIVKSVPGVDKAGRSIIAKQTTNAFLVGYAEKFQQPIGFGADNQLGFAEATGDFTVSVKPGEKEESTLVLDMKAESLNIFVGEKGKEKLAFSGKAPFTVAKTTKQEFDSQGRLVVKEQSPMSELLLGSKVRFAKGGELKIVAFDPAKKLVNLLIPDLGPIESPVLEIDSMEWVIPSKEELDSVKTEERTVTGVVTGRVRFTPEAEAALAKNERTKEVYAELKNGRIALTAPLKNAVNIAEFRTGEITPPEGMLMSLSGNEVVLRDAKNNVMMKGDVSLGFDIRREANTGSIGDLLDQSDITLGIQRAKIIKEQAGRFAVLGLLTDGAGRQLFGDLAGDVSMEDMKFVFRRNIDPIKGRESDPTAQLTGRMYIPLSPNGLLKANSMVAELDKTGLIFTQDGDVIKVDPSTAAPSLKVYRAGQEQPVFSTELKAIAGLNSYGKEVSDLNVQLERTSAELFGGQLKNGAINLIVSKKNGVGSVTGSYSAVAEDIGLHGLKAQIGGALYASPEAAFITVGTDGNENSAFTYNGKEVPGTLNLRLTKTDANGNPVGIESSSTAVPLKNYALLTGEASFRHNFLDPMVGEDAAKDSVVEIGSLKLFFNDEGVPVLLEPADVHFKQAVEVDGVAAVIEDTLKAFSPADLAGKPSEGQFRLERPQSGEKGKVTLLIDGKEAGKGTFETLGELAFLRTEPSPDLNERRESHPLFPERKRLLNEWQAAKTVDEKIAIETKIADVEARIDSDVSDVAKVGESTYLAGRLQFKNFEGNIGDIKLKGGAVNPADLSANPVNAFVNFELGEKGLYVEKAAGKVDFLKKGESGDETFLSLNPEILGLQALPDGRYHVEDAGLGIQTFSKGIAQGQGRIGIGDVYFKVDTSAEGEPRVSEFIANRESISVLTPAGNPVEIAGKGFRMISKEITDAEGKKSYTYPIEFGTLEGRAQAYRDEWEGLVPMFINRVLLGKPYDLTQYTAYATTGDKPLVFEDIWANLKRTLNAYDAKQDFAYAAGVGMKGAQGDFVANVLQADRYDVDQLFNTYNQKVSDEVLRVAKQVQSKDITKEQGQALLTQRINVLGDQLGSELYDASSTIANGQVVFKKDEWSQTLVKSAVGHALEHALVGKGGTDTVLTLASHGSSFFLGPPGAVLNYIAFGNGALKIADTLNTVFTDIYPSYKSFDNGYDDSLKYKSTLDPQKVMNLLDSKGQFDIMENHAYDALRIKDVQSRREDGRGWTQFESDLYRKLENRKDGNLEVKLTASEEQFVRDSEEDYLVRQSKQGFPVPIQTLESLVNQRTKEGRELFNGRQGSKGVQVQNRYALETQQRQVRLLDGTTKIVQDQFIRDTQQNKRLDFYVEPNSDPEKVNDIIRLFNIDAALTGKGVEQLKEEFKQQQMLREQAYQQGRIPAAP